jgi:hypothetical protein
MTRTQPRSSAHRNLDAFTLPSRSGARALSYRLSPRFRRSQPNSDETTELQPRLRRGVVSGHGPPSRVGSAGQTGVSLKYF